MAEGQNVVDGYSYVSIMIQYESKNGTEESQS